MRLTSVILGACGLGFSTAQSDPLEGYAFLYFTGENIFLAASAGNDASNWTELNGGQPIYKSSYGTKGLRDPFVIRSAEGVLDRTTGKYYLFWGNTGTGQPLYAELADDMVTLKEETLATASGLTKLREGVFVNYRQGLFHMTFDRRHRLAVSSSRRMQKREFSQQDTMVSCKCLRPSIGILRIIGSGWEWDESGDDY